MNTKRSISLVVVAGCLWPLTAKADVGTPLVWANAFHLLIGNALIGLFEAYLLVRFFGVRQCRLLIIAANYFSMWSGTFLLSNQFDRRAGDIYSGLAVTWALVGVTYAMTLILEWPFVALAFRKRPDWLAGSIKGSLLIQSASYLILFGGYWMLSGTSLYNKMTVVQPSGMAKPEGVSMFFISAKDGNVYKCDVSEGSDQKVFDLKSTDRWDHLILQEWSTDTRIWDLAVVKHRDSEPAALILPAVTSDDHILRRSAYETQRYGGWGQGIQIGAATNSAWHFTWCNWADIGMWGRNQSNRADHIRVAFGTFFGGWEPRRIIQLPDEKLLVQLGDHQICLFDLHTKRVSLLRRGYGMLAVADGPSELRPAGGSQRTGEPPSSGTALGR